MELQLILYVLAGEAAILLLAFGLFLLVKRLRRPKKPGLTLPDELAAEAKQYLQAELEKTEAHLAKAGQGTKAALERRLAALRCELAAIAVADRPDNFWAAIQMGYGTMGATEPDKKPAEAST